jgi:Rap1a immunity proteins
MKMTAVVAAMVLLVVPVVAQKGPARSTSDGKAVLRACSLTLDLNVYHPREVKDKFEAFDLGYCLGLVEGVYANASGTEFCPGERNVGTKEVLELTVKFVKAHPELQEKAGADIVRWALSDEFPCAKSQP